MNSKAPFIVGLIGATSLAFVAGLYVGRGSAERPAPVIEENLVTRARAPDENALIAANAERPEATLPQATASTEPEPTVQKASSPAGREAQESLEAIEDVLDAIDGGGKRDGK